MISRHYEGRVTRSGAMKFESQKRWYAASEPEVWQARAQQPDISGARLWDKTSGEKRR
jgi:hypothetical protein